MMRCCKDEPNNGLQGTPKSYARSSLRFSPPLSLGVMKKELVPTNNYNEMLMLQRLLIAATILIFYPLTASAEIIKLICKGTESQSFTIDTYKNTVVDMVGLRSDYFFIHEGSYVFKNTYSNGDSFLFIISRADGDMTMTHYNANGQPVGDYQYQCNRIQDNKF